MKCQHCNAPIVSSYDRDGVKCCDITCFALLREEQSGTGEVQVPLVPMDETFGYLKDYGNG